MKWEGFSVENFKKSIFLSEIKMQCQFANLALKKMTSFLNSEERDTLQFWSDVQSFLVATANVHKLIFNKDEQLSKQLQAELNTHGTTLRKAKSVRNRFEHLDDDILEWYENSKNHNIASYIIGPRGGMIGGLEKKSEFKAYYTGEDVICSYGKEIKVMEVSQELGKIYKRVCELTN